VRAARPAGPPAGQTGAGLKTTMIGCTTVLTNGQGFTLYWFAPDTPGRSACNGVCAQYWPPVTAGRRPGPVSPGGWVRSPRSDGSTQATYGRHPLYTYVADTGPGQANGNNLNSGHWHAHEGRHTAVSIMSSDGVPLQEISDTVGHKSTM
jgi:predicted lipoprotein with Yx(FWY)xxD motif